MKKEVLLAVSGYFDPIHVGHLEYLQLASELGEKLIDICLVIIGKAVKLTKTDADDKLFEQVSKAIKSR